MKPIDISPSGFKYDVMYNITGLNDYLVRAISDKFHEYRDRDAGYYMWGQRIIFRSSAAAFTENPCVLIVLPNTGSGGIHNLCIYKNSYTEFLEVVDGLEVTIDTDCARNLIAKYQKKIADIEKAYGLEDYDEHY